MKVCPPKGDNRVQGERTVLARVEECWELGMLLTGRGRNRRQDGGEGHGEVGVIAFQAPPSLGFSRQEYWSG